MVGKTNVVGVAMIMESIVSNWIGVKVLQVIVVGRCNVEEVRWE